MKIRMTWQEFINLAINNIAKAHPNLSDKINFRKKYGSEPEGDFYDHPDFVDIELKKSDD